MGWKIEWKIKREIKREIKWQQQVELFVEERKE